MPEHIEPMLAQIGKGEPPPGDDWLYEIKWDGVRAICYIDHGKLRMVSRNGNAWIVSILSCRSCRIT